MLPVPACQRAVIVAKEALLRAGHILVPFSVPNVENAIDISNAGLWAEGGKSWLNNLKNDVISSSIQAVVSKLMRSSINRYLIATYYYWKGFTRLSRDMQISGGEDQSALRAWNYQQKADIYKNMFFEKWNKLHLDAIICPSFPIVACKLEEINHINVFWSYTVLYNLLNCPAGVVNITNVTTDDISRLRNYRGHYDDPWDEQIKNANKNSNGMPISVQCVSLPYEDEKCLKLMKEVESLLC